MTENPIEVLLEEAAHAREALSRTIGTVYTLYGIIVPAILAGVAILATENLLVEQLYILGAGLLILVCGAIAFANSLWMEGFEYVRYMYLELFPRMYRLTGLTGERNFFQYQAEGRSWFSWLPNWLFDLLIYVAVSTVGIGTIMEGVEQREPHARALLFLAIFCLVLSAASTVIVIAASQKLFSELEIAARQVRLSR
jgi:hypothetical protein